MGAAVLPPAVVSIRKKAVSLRTDSTRTDSIRTKQA